MDKPNMNKRKTFSPSSIEQVEQDTYSRLCGTDNRYEVSEEWKGREPDLWEQLHSEISCTVEHASRSRYSQVLPELSRLS